MNSVNLMGRLCNDIEIRNTTTGKAVGTFLLAVRAGKDKSYFFPCVAWEGTADTIAKYFHKGDLIGISGILTSRQYEDNSGSKRTVIEVNVNAIDFCSSKGEGQKASGNPPQTPEPSPSPEAEEPMGQLPFEI